MCGQGGGGRGGRRLGRSQTPGPSRRGQDQEASLQLTCIIFIFQADSSGGFCMMNNVAIAAMYAVKEHGLERVLILDWDVHHGNGTQHMFYDDPRVLYISLHR